MLFIKKILNYIFTIKLSVHYNKFIIMNLYNVIRDDESEPSNFVIFLKSKDKINIVYD